MASEIVARTQNSITIKKTSAMGFSEDPKLILAAAKITKSVLIEFPEKEKPKVTFKGEWRRVDIDKAYLALRSNLLQYIKTQKEEIEKCQKQSIANQQKAQSLTKK